ncbi:MAG: KOW domain-containing RNA-binding protein [Eubacteriales bacterium]|nr:KOW domain-containing RNA-binding protein [Eubacteriales bacterium]
MDTSVPEPGTVVRSRAGRDSGRYFVITAVIDEKYVLICDGDVRRLANPKRKKLKHLELTPVCIPTLREGLRSAGGVYDAEIRKNLESLGYCEGRR